MMYFDAPLLNGLLSELSERDHPQFEFTSAVFTNEPLRAKLEESFHALADTTADRLHLDSLSLEIVGRLHELAAQTQKSTNTAASTSDQSVRKALDLIHADPASEALTLERLAREVGVSRYHFIRTFTQKMCLTPHAYIVQQRLLYARALMRTGQALAEIAPLAGFTDQSHFSKAFSRHYGLAPGRYLKSLR